MAVLLLSLSCAASACSVSCDLIGMSQTHVSQTAHSMMAGMSHCSMAQHTAGLDKSGEATRASLNVVSCTHHECGTQPIILNSKTDSLTWLYDAATLTVIYMPADTGSQSRASETPPLRTSSLTSLQTILRV